MSELFDRDDPWLEWEERANRNRENHARMATVNAEFITVGHGVVEFPDLVDFGLYFVGQPSFSHGCFTDMDAFRDITGIEEDGAITMLPQVTGFVADWDLERHNLYTGAHCAASVVLPQDLWEAKVEVRHCFTFIGTALKAPANSET